MTRLRKLFMGGAVATVALVGLGEAVSHAQTYDPAQLPETKGSVVRYSLSPRGDVDGLILKDGTEVHLPPHLGTQLVYTVKPGDAVTVHGLKALRLPLVQAASVTNDATGQTVLDKGPPPPPPEPRGWHGPAKGGQEELSAQGKVQIVLHGPRGEANGALLEDGTFLRLPPPEAERLTAMLAAGQTVVARGPGQSSPLGTVIEVRRIGPTADQLTEVAPPPPPPHGPKGHRPPPPAEG